MTKGVCMNIEDEILINSIIDRRDGQQFIEKLIKSYCSLCVENCQHLLELIPDIAKIEIGQYYDKMLNYCRASNWLIVQQNMNKSDKSSYFASMVPVMQTLYPGGLDDNESEARIKYFNEFLLLVNDPKVFSFDNPDDVEWASQFGYIDYLKFVHEKYC